jgi:DNA topoisomerase-1
VCWRKIRQGLSAGRVQSPSVRLVVERERERMAFVAASYWDLAATFPTEPAFTAQLATVDGDRVAGSRDFDSQGRTKRDDVAVLDEVAAQRLKDGLADRPFAVTAVETKPYTSKPKPPFITSTLQQVGGSRLRMSSRQVMSIAQGLYEDGYITYMRTDSTTLSDTAISAARQVIERQFGREYLTDQPRTYTKKAKNAQEAHEAIRPAGDTWRSPDELKNELRADQLRLYELIWQRTLASQMPDARGNTVTVRIAATTTDDVATEWTASGRTITFPGWQAVYGYGGEDDADEAGDDSAKLPALTEGQALPNPDLEAAGHTTQPPPRYTEATLVKTLEEKGIGRPSTYASIMQTIQDRGYVWKKGQALVPTTDAFAVVALLEQHFSHLVDYEFTARMEDDLDEIAGGRQQRVPWLHQFWFGNGTPGVKGLKDKALEEADAEAINTIPLGVDENGELIVIRNGRYGPYLRRGEDTASIPEDLPLDELTIEKAMEILSAPKGGEPLGEDPETGLPVFAKSGRFGPYVQLGDADTLPPDTKPKMSSLFQTMSLSTITLDEALQVLRLPRTVGAHPEDGKEIVAANGRYGPYVKWGDETRSLDSEEQLLTVSLDEAVKILAEPKKFGRRRAAPAPPLRELGNDPVSEKPVVVKDGRFGPYVTDGDTNASLRKGDTVENITIERAAELLQIRRDAGPAKKARKGAKKAAPKKAAKKSAGKKAAAKKKAPSKAASKAAETAPPPASE